MPEEAQFPVPYKFVEVEWSDAHSCTGWETPAAFPAPAAVRSRGWLVKDEIDYVCLASSITDEGEYGELIAIPRGMVEHLTPLEV